MAPENGGFTPYTFEEAYELIFQRARLLHALGLRRGDRMALIGESCMDWAVTDWAAQTLGVVLVPVYPTLPPDQAEHIIRDSGSRVVIALNRRLASKVEGLPDVRVEVVPGCEVEPTLTREEWEEAIDGTKPDDLATLIYTSGTTGAPKGVELVHRCFVSLCESCRQGMPIDNTDVFLSVLPLSHVYERFAGHVLPTSLGACVAYAGSVASIGSDLLKVRPTIVMTVPRLLEAIRTRVSNTVAKLPIAKRILFKMALASGSRHARGKFAPLHGFLDSRVLATVRAQVGGNMRFFVSGGAALPDATVRFFHAVGITVLQGYGLTETTAVTCVNHPDDDRPETVGPVIPGVQVMLAPDGEILVKGASVMRGYYHLPDATREAIDADGWFHTGDVGVMVGDKVKITDRKKDILVLVNGKNVAPQLLENKLKDSEYVEEAVVFGDGMEHLCALIEPAFEPMRAHLAAKGIKVERPEAVAAHPEARKTIKAHVDHVNRTLADFEKVKRFELIGDHFSVETGELTPSLKVRRKVVREKYRRVIDRMAR